MNVAVVGLGFMGMTHLKAWHSVPDARVVAVMSSDARKLAGDLTGVGGNLGIEGERFDFSEMHKYAALDRLLSDPSIDAVDICLPSNLHARSAVAALEAGKHVFVEKPLALNSVDAFSVVEASERCGRALMVGHVLRFLRPYRELRTKLLDAGRILSAVFERNCAVPAWMDVAGSGGPVLDLLIHDIDYCISLWGMPDRVSAGELHFKGMGPVTIDGGWHDERDYPFSMKFRVETEAGTFRWQSGESDSDGEDPFAAELAAFTQYVRSGGSHPCPPRESVAAVLVAERMIEARSAGDARCLK